MRYRRAILSCTSLLMLLGAASLRAQCPATAAPGQFVSFQLSATAEGQPAPDSQGLTWLVSPTYMSASPQGNHNTTISGTIPGNASGSVQIQASYNQGSSPLYSFSCTIQIVSPPLQISGFCPSNTFQPNDTISIPFSASGGVTHQYIWGVTTPFSVPLQTGPSTLVQGNAPQQSTTFTLTLRESPPPPSSNFPAAQPTSITCLINVVVTPLTITGSCPSNTFKPNDIISLPFSASGGVTKQYIWGVTTPFSVSPQTGPSTFVQGNAPPQSTTFTLTLRETPPPAGFTVSSAQAPSITCQIIVAATPLSITGTCPTTTFAPGALVNIPLSASGGSGTYAWVLDPPITGLSLTNSTGTSTVVTGTPSLGTQVGFTVTLMDPVLKVPPALFICSITVAAPLHIDGVCPTQPLVTGVSFSLPLTGSGGVAPYTWKVSASPLTPSSNTGSNITVNGAPTTPGTITVSATLVDSIGTPPASFSCPLRVVAPLSISGSCPITQIQGQSFTVPLSATGGTGTYSWTVTGPSFLSLTSATGASTSLTGTPPDPGTFPFTVNLADDAKTPLSAPFACSVQVDPKLTLLPTAFPDGVVGQPYPATTVNVTGGVPPLIFRVSTGSLPPGLVIDRATGTVTGTPTQAGTFPFTVTVTDSGRQLVSGPYVIIVTGIPPQNTTACPLPTGTELQPYNAPLTATGGTGQYTFTLTGNSLLPPGLVLDQNAITGTPQGPFPSTPLSFQLASGTQTQTFTCAIAVLGRKPNVTVNGLFTSAGSPLVTTTISLDAPVQEDVTGTAALSFTPDVPNTAIKDNPQVQFCGGNAGDPLCSTAQKDSAGLLRLIPFTVRAGLTSVDLSPLVTSNVAGTIQIALNNLTVGPQTFTAPPLQFTISRTPPAILSIQVSRSGQNLQLTVKASSSTCELASATASFAPTAGSDLQGPNGGNPTSTTDLSSLFRSFTPFGVDTTHPIGGCAFTLTLPYSINGDPAAIASVSLTLTSTAGPSSSANLPVQ
jgi:hypothetical protein